ncbi:hypothetical protein E3V33_00095 [Candidatus Marinimicrobia bacterium MT.SAG.4]|nr:hypothetical protein E3V33_00095 [Candidatus Marinimicrobia bacterium MT.SAG.4]
MSKQPIILCSVASNDFLHYIERLLASAGTNLPEALFYIVLVNVDKIKAEYLNSLYGNLILEHDYVHFNNHADQQGYCTNRRSTLLPHLLKKYNSPVVWIDADSLIIKPAQELIEYANSCDFSVMYSDSHPLLNMSEKKRMKLPKGPLGSPYYGVFSAGLITMKNSQIMKEFVDSWAKKVEKKKLSWYADQEGLFLTYLDYKDKIKFRSLPEKYWGRYYSEDIIIWVPKGYYRDKIDFYSIGENYIIDKRNWPVIEIEEEIYITAEVDSIIKIKKLMGKIVRKIIRIFGLRKFIE